MPVYEYKCTKCHKHFDVQQKFSDLAVKECKYCGAPVKKVFHATGVVFKGSGFHVNDYSRGKESKPAATPAATKPESKKEEKK